MSRPVIASESCLCTPERPHGIGAFGNSDIAIIACRPTGASHRQNLRTRQAGFGVWSVARCYWWWRYLRRNID